jgi:hypothetical protein
MLQSFTSLPMTHSAPNLGFGNRYGITRIGWGEIGGGGFGNRINMSGRP